MISEDRLRQAVRDAGALLDQSLPDPDQCHHTFSPAFLNRMEALLRRRKRAPVYRVLKGVACFFLLGGTIFLSTNAQAREAFFGWLSESFNRFLIISLDVLICRYSPLFRAFPALFISEEPHKSFYYPSCFRSQK